MALPADRKKWFECVTEIISSVFPRKKVLLTEAKVISSPSTAEKRYVCEGLVENMIEEESLETKEITSHLAKDDI